MTKKKTTTKKNEIATNSQFTIEGVPQMLEAVMAKLKALKGDDDGATGTNGNIPGFGNIFEEISPSNLIKAYSSVEGKEAAYAKAIKGMGISGAPKFDIGGFTAEAWKRDITNRYIAVTKEKEIAKLTAVKEKLSKYQTEEQRFQNDIGDIVELLAD